MGLSRQHHGELNRLGISRRRFQELREEYANDSVALQQIDVYDGSTEYNIKLMEFVDAVKNKDEVSERRLAERFNTYYPDIK